MTPRLRLPGTVQLDVEFFGKHYPAWLERWTRRVWTIAGEASFAARLVISYDRGRRQRRHAEKLKDRLWKWGYRLTTLKPRRSAPSSSGSAPGSSPAT